MTVDQPDLIVRVGANDEFVIEARLERQLAPKTCAAIEELLPLKRELLHVRWSGEGVWAPLADLDLLVGPENATAHPLPGQVVLYADPLSENEILIAYGSTSFASIAGPLAGNHFLTLAASETQLREIGRRTLWEGAQPITIDRPAGDQSMS